MSGPTGSWSADVLPSGQTGEAYRALKLPGEHGVKWKDGYPVVRFERTSAGMYVASVGGIAIADLVDQGGGGFNWVWTTNVQLYPVTASGEARTLAYAKDQISDVIKHICGTPRP